MPQITMYPQESKARIMLHCPTFDPNWLIWALLTCCQYEVANLGVLPTSSQSRQWELDLDAKSIGWPVSKSVATDICFEYRSMPKPGNISMRRSTYSISVPYQRGKWQCSLDIHTSRWSEYIQFGRVSALPPYCTVDIDFVLHDMRNQHAWDGNLVLDRRKYCTVPDSKICNGKDCLQLLWYLTTA